MQDLRLVSSNPVFSCVRSRRNLVVAPQMTLFWLQTRHTIPNKHIPTKKKHNQLLKAIAVGRFWYFYQGLETLKPFTKTLERELLFSYICWLYLKHQIHFWGMYNVNNNKKEKISSFTGQSTRTPFPPRTVCSTPCVSPTVIGPHPLSHHHQLQLSTRTQDPWPRAPCTEDRATPPCTRLS